MDDTLGFSTARQEGSYFSDGIDVSQLDRMIGGHSQTRNRLSVFQAIQTCWRHFGAGEVERPECQLYLNAASIGPVPSQARTRALEKRWKKTVAERFARTILANQSTVGR